MTTLVNPVMFSSLEVSSAPYQPSRLVFDGDCNQPLKGLYFEPNANITECIESHLLPLLRSQPALDPDRLSLYVPAPMHSSPFYYPSLQYQSR